MYVKKLPFVELPMESGAQPCLGLGPIKKWVQCPNPAVTIGPASRILAHNSTLCVLSVANFTQGN